MVRYTGVFSCPQPKCYTGIYEYEPAEAENFCRNPDGFSDCKLEKPWCHTTDGRREYCDVPLCGKLGVTVTCLCQADLCHATMIGWL